jgi:hypothetical protein
VDDWLNMLYEYAIIDDKKVLEVAEKCLTVTARKLN